MNIDLPIAQLAKGKTEILNSNKSMFDGNSLTKNTTKAVIGGSLDGGPPTSATTVAMR